LGELGHKAWLVVLKRSVDGQRDKTAWAAVRRRLLASPRPDFYLFLLANPGRVASWFQQYLVNSGLSML